MRQVAIEEAGPQLAELVREAQNGEDVVLTQDGTSVVKLVALADEKPGPKFGSAKGIIVYVADDFDAPLEDFKEYR